MQAGLAQISDNNPDVIQLIEGNKVGFCVAPDNPRAIAEKVNLLFQDKSLRAKFGSNGHRLYETEFYYEKEFAPVLSFILEKNQMTAHL
jgi:glycosyltransferase involved in cell wall biosynthesis